MKALMLGAALLLSATGWAVVDDPQIGTPGFGGPGCPDGSAILIASPNGNSLGLLFGQYLVRAGGADGKGMDRQACALAVPVKVPAGMSVAIEMVDMRGYASLPDGAEAIISIEPFFAGTQGPKQQTTLKGPSSAAFAVQVAPADNAVWSACGADVNLRVNASVRVTAGDAPAFVNVYGLTLYRLKTKSC